MQRNWRASFSVGSTAVLACITAALICPAETKASEIARREKSFTVENKYLVIPIQNQGKVRTVIHLSIGDKEVRRYKLEPAMSVEETDWYAYFTIERYKGKEARVVVDKSTEEGFLP